MKRSIAFLVLLQVLPAVVLAEGPSWEEIPQAAEDLQAVLVKVDQPEVIYLGAKSGVYKNKSGAKAGKIVLTLPATCEGVKALRFGRDSRYLYAATGKGLYFSTDSGERWRKIFRGRNYLEEDCAAVREFSDEIYLGTKGGLFISRDGGWNWQKAGGQLKDEAVYAIASRGRPGDWVYVAALSGVFKARPGGGVWERIFVAHPAEVVDNAEAVEDSRDREPRVSEIKDIAVSAQGEDILYLATGQGIYQSKDQGANWQPLPEYGLLNRRILKIFISPSNQLYALSPSGIFVFNQAGWNEISLGLAAEEVRDLSWDKEENLYAACPFGLFRYGVYDAKGRQEDYNPFRLDANGEPSIREVQEKAIQYAEVQPEKIALWRKQAARKAWLPKLTTKVNRDTADLWHWESGSTTKADDDFLRRGRDSVEWDVSLSWELSQLIWSDDQTNIDVRSRLMVELRDDILDEVTKLYFQRLQAKADLEQLAIEDKKKRFEKELRIEELGASLDALTGGYFSRALREKISNHQ